MSSLFTDELILGVKIRELVSSIDFEIDEVGLWMPKFKIAYEFDNLQENLEKLGVRRAFSPKQAELGNIPLKVSLL